MLVTLGTQKSIGTEDHWLGVSGATMYWSHFDWPTYREWITSRGLAIVYDRFVPDRLDDDDTRGHQLVLARKTIG